MIFQFYVVLGYLYFTPFAIIIFARINISVDDSFDVNNGPKAAEFITVNFFSLSVSLTIGVIYFYSIYLFILLWPGCCN